MLLSPISNPHLVSVLSKIILSMNQGGFLEPKSLEQTELKVQRKRKKSLFNSIPKVAISHRTH